MEETVLNGFLKNSHFLFLRRVLARNGSGLFLCRQLNDNKKERKSESRVCSIFINRRINPMKSNNDNKIGLCGESLQILPHLELIKSW